MITDEDIEKLNTKFATKDELRNEIDGLRTEMKQEFTEVRSELIDLRSMFRGMMVTLDGLVKSMQELRGEYAAISTILTRHERWHHQVEDHLQIQLSRD